MTFSPEERKVIEDAIRRAGSGAATFSTLEDVLVSPHGFGVTTATPLQRAICRLVDGQPLGDLKGHPHVKKAIGNIEQIEGHRPKKVALCAGIRTFKSMLAAAAGVRAPQVVDTSPMLRREGARFSVVSTTKDNARKVLSHATGLVHGKDQAEAMLAREPSADTLHLRHREGREFAFKVTHGGRAGAGLVTDWSAGLVLDEASRMLSSNEGVVNIDDAINAVEGRLLPGAQMFLISSPWAPFGTFYEWVTHHHLMPTPDLLVVWAEAPWLNPHWWTEERCAGLKISNPEAYMTDVKARFRTPEENIYSSGIVEPARRQEPWDLPPAAGYTYQAAMDPATRRNAWTMTLVTKDAKIRVALARQWLPRPDKKLRPREVLNEMAQILQPYGVNQITTDQWSVDANQDLALESKLEDGTPYPLYLYEWRMSAEEKNDAYGKIKTLLEEDEYELHPEPHLRDDMLRVKRKTTQSSVQIVLPITGDGRHCDFVPPLAMATAPYLQDYEKPLPPEGTPEYWKAREALDIQREIAEIEDEQSREWWE